MPFTAAPTIARSWKPLAVALVIVMVLVGSTAEGDAQDARQERARVQSERAQVASQVDALQADQSNVADALATIDANVRTQQLAAAEATRAAAASAAEAEASQRAADASAAELADLRGRLTRLAVSAYVDPPGEDLLRRFEAASAQEDATRRALMSRRSGRDVDVIDQVRATQRRLDDERRRAEAARASAEADRSEAEAAVASLTSARADQERFAAQVRQRLDERLADAGALARLDAGLAARIVAEESAVAAAVARLAPPPDTSSRPDPGSPSRESPGSTPAPGPTSGPPSTPRPRPPTPSLRTVGGITVNVSIADRLGALLGAASEDGISLGGSGYRDMNAQIALRRQNCGTSDFAIWDMSPDQCSPPTARPGLSMHEQGLAIDFTANGRFISSRTDPGFVWLAANAGRFGFSNLPSEPWHWSTTGG